MTLRDHVARAMRQLDHAGIEGASREAWLLLGSVLGVTRATLLARALEPLSPAAATRYNALIARRVKREPFAQITGEKEFWSLSFLVSSAVLCPRPDSEALIELTLDRVGQNPGPLHLLDLGTGSGCLLLALLKEWPAAAAIGIDRSPEALALAKANGERLGLADRVTWLLGDWGASLDGSFDVIISNPPYIEEGDWQGLEPEVRLFEPKLALTAGEDGLDAYRRLAPEIARLLAPSGVACLEHGMDQAEAVAAIMAKAGLKRLDGRRDLAGLERCLAVGPRDRVNAF